MSRAFTRETVGVRIRYLQRLELNRRRVDAVSGEEGKDLTVLRVSPAWATVRSLPVLA